jgi:hypothetical protein
MPPKSSWAVPRSLNRGRYNVAAILRRGFVRPIHRMGANGLIDSENKTDHITFSLSADGKLVEKGGARFEQIGGHIYSNRQVASETFEGSFRRGTLADGARAVGK